MASAGLGLALAAVMAVQGRYGMMAGALAQSALSLAAALAGPFRAPARLEPEVRRDDVAGDFLQACPDPVLALNQRLVISDINGSALAIIPGARAGQPLSFSLRAPEVLDAARRVLASGEGETVEYVVRSGIEATYEVRLRPIVTASGPEPDLVALFFRDLTAERRLERLRVDFVATVSHELRTPLASLSGFIDTLKGPARNDTEARERFLDIMRQQADRMTRLVDDLLALSRVELRAHLAPNTPVDLKLIAGHMLEVMSQLASERDVELALEADAGPFEVLGERDELLRMIENLVENAIKYGGSGGRVRLSLRRGGPGDAVELRVIDNGPGIAAEHLPRLTERFYRVDVRGSRSQGGTGLGLAIVKHIVVRHRGRLLLESVPGEGTTAIVQLPTPRPLPAATVTGLSSKLHKDAAGEP